MSTSYYKMRMTHTRQHISSFPRAISREYCTDLELEEVDLIWCLSREGAMVAGWMVGWVSGGLKRITFEFTCILCLFRTYYDSPLSRGIGCLVVWSFFVFVFSDGLCCKVLSYEMLCFNVTQGYVKWHGVM